MPQVTDCTLGYIYIYIRRLMCNRFCKDIRNIAKESEWDWAMGEIHFTLATWCPRVYETQGECWQQDQALWKPIAIEYHIAVSFQWFLLIRCASDLVLARTPVMFLSNVVLFRVNASTSTYCLSYESAWAIIKKLHLRRHIHCCWINSKYESTVWWWEHLLCLYIHSPTQVQLRSSLAYEIGGHTTHNQVCLVKIVEGVLKTWFVLFLGWTVSMLLRRIACVLLLLKKLSLQCLQWRDIQKVPEGSRCWGSQHQQ